MTPAEILRLARRLVGANEADIRAAIFAAVDAEAEACADVAFKYHYAMEAAKAVRARIAARRENTGKPDVVTGGPEGVYVLRGDPAAAREGERDPRLTAPAAHARLTKLIDALRSICSCGCGGVHDLKHHTGNCLAVAVQGAFPR